MFIFDDNDDETTTSLGPRRPRLTAWIFPVIGLSVLVISALILCAIFWPSTWLPIAVCVSPVVFLVPMAVIAVLAWLGH